jgi:membrane protease YdiL (CAAX protease family)
MVSFINDLYKKVVRKQIMMEALALLGFYAANFGIVFFMTMIALVVTGSRNLGSDFTGLSSIIGIIAGTAVIFMLRGKRLVTTDMTHENEPLNGKDFMIIILLMFAIQAALFFINLLITVITSPIVGDTSSTYENSMGALMSPIGYLYIVLIGPIFEEIIFRAGFMRSLERFGANYAIVVSSLFFGLYHIFFNQIPFAFMVGLLLGYTARRFSIKWAILLHIINNSYSVLLSLLTSISNTVAAVVVLFVLVAYIAILIVAIIYLARNRLKLKEHLSTGKPSSMFHVLGMQHLLATFGYQADAALQYQQSVEQFSASPAAMYAAVSPAIPPQYASVPQTPIQVSQQQVPMQAQSQYGQASAQAQTFGQPQPQPQPQYSQYGQASAQSQAYGQQSQAQSQQAQYAQAPAQAQQYGQVQAQQYGQSQQYPQAAQAPAQVQDLAYQQQAAQYRQNQLQVQQAAPGQYAQSQYQSETPATHPQIPQPTTAGQVSYGQVGAAQFPVQTQQYQQPSQMQQPGVPSIPQNQTQKVSYQTAAQPVQQYQTGYQPVAQYQQPQQPSQAPPQIMAQLPAQASAGDINQAFSLYKETGVSLPPAQPGEPVPHPFRITFTSPFFIATAASLVFFGLLAALSPLFS